MRKPILILTALLLVAGLTHCGSEDADVRRGNLFYKNHQWFEAFSAYEKAMARNPKTFEAKDLRENFKNAYYYYGGTMEINGSLEAGKKYYELGFALVPTDAGICDKLAKFYWEKEEFEPAAKYFAILVDLDAQAPDTKQKWQVLGNDYYALGYSLFEMKKYPAAIEALQQSLKASPAGQFAGKAKSAMESAKFEMKKKK
jgi:tetratricopeptide (TPR) repeat protein